MPGPSDFGVWALMLYPFEDWVDNLLKEELLCPRDSIIEESFRQYEECIVKDQLDTAQRHDMRLYMLDDILVKVDRMSMLNSSRLVAFSRLSVGRTRVAHSSQVKSEGR